MMLALKVNDTYLFLLNIMWGRTSSLHIDCGNAISESDTTAMLSVETGGTVIAQESKR